MGRLSRVSWVVAVVAVLGLLITISASLAAAALNQHNEKRLLSLQVRQAGAVISAAIPEISDPLSTVLQVEVATDGSSAEFRRLMARYTGTGGLFVSASLWRERGATITSSVSVGQPPVMTTATPAASRLLTRALRSKTFVVVSVHHRSTERIGYLVADPDQPGLAVYAERAIPADRRVPVETNSAFADLNYATYLGAATNADIATTDEDVDRLPLSGDVARVAIPFGDTQLILVASPRGHLGGTLENELSWIILVAGLLLTLSTAMACEQLVRRRRQAEGVAAAISVLANERDQLYAEQRTIAETLQRALLPAFNPEISELEIASRYIAGAHGVEIGGDWYSLIRIDEEHVGFAVGDVSGRGVSAAAIMARLRFTIRAYLLEGHPPDVVLSMCSEQIDSEVDGHFATVLVGVANLISREITVTNAGHPPALILGDADPYYLATEIGPPIGVVPTTYTPTTATLPAGATLLTFTDGLVERRDESIDDGLNRLALLTAGSTGSLEELMTEITDRLIDAESEDDVAILAFRWRAAGISAPDSGRPAG